MKLEPPGVYKVTTKSSTYLIDAGALRVVRNPGAIKSGFGAGSQGAASAPRPLFTDRVPLALAEVPEPVIGQRMRMRIRVAEEFLDHASKGKPTGMVTTEVISVTQLPTAR